MAAFYSNTIEGFINEPIHAIVGTLTSQSSSAGFYQQKHSQTASWIEEFEILKVALKDVIEKKSVAKDWGVLLEYPIARREKRIDIVLVANSVIIVIEFKSGKFDYSTTDKDQLLDYCLDLRDFHFESRNKIIVPVLLATNAKTAYNQVSNNEQLVQNIILANSSNIGECLVSAFNHFDEDVKILDYKKWNKSDYSPTPTIIEAAQTLYAGKSVIEITRSHAEENLSATTNAVIDAIKEAKKLNRKIICFITGVPGAGKTLAGLNIAHDEEFQQDETSLATFLSGNGPLIKVLRGALSRDAFKKLQKNDKSARKKETDRIISFIENVHRFIDAYFFDKEKIPNNKVVIFDEAQRAWNAEHSFRKFNRPFSEPEMMLDIMNRHTGWSVIVALVGGGQEINTGEAGLPEWGRIIEQKFSNWRIYISPSLKVGDHSTGDLPLFQKVPLNVEVIENEHLHLKVSLRSYKAENLSKWVGLVLNNKPTEAKIVYNKDLKDYEIVLTRDLNEAKKWLKIKCQGTRRMGLVATSGARRLRPYGLDVKSELEVEEWFLNTKEDVRSSYYLEVPATEFGIQGLELDWTGLCWDADLRRTESEWDTKSFKGTKWQSVSKVETRKYILNKYRVLLTRGREGMVIFIPVGDDEDPTRDPQFYNLIADYLKACGVKELS
jgi:DUF2075 family protein